MSKMVFISSHCDTDDKLKVLKTNLEILKKLNVKIFLYSSVNLESDIVSIVDFYFYNSINPINEARGLLFWKEDFYNNKKIKFCRFWKDNLIGGYYQVKYLIQMSRIFNFDFNYFILYDLVITNDVIDFISNKNKEGFFSFLASENGVYTENDRF